MTRAVFLVPSGEFDQFYRPCLDHSVRNGYDVTEVVSDWPSAARLLQSGMADVLVVARPEHLDPRREPRVEVAYPSEPPRSGGRYRRPRVV